MKKYVSYIIICSFFISCNFINRNSNFSQNISTEYSDIIPYLANNVSLDSASPMPGILS